MINSSFEFCYLFEKNEDKTIQIYVENAIHWALQNQRSQDYQFKCLAFVEDAYEQANQIEMFGGASAAESAAQYGVISSSPPPKGAFVFYDAEGTINGVFKNWGHVGLCIGEEHIIHTWDKIRIDHYKGLEKLQNAPTWSPLKYLGWTAPEIFLKGHKIKDYK